MSKASGALGHVFGQRRRYAIVGALAYRGPLTAVGIAILIRSPAFVVRRDLAILQRARLVQVIDDERKPRYLIAHRYANSEVQQLRNAVAARDQMLAKDSGR